MTTQETCRQRWYREKEGRMSDLRKLWHAECLGRDVKNLGHLNEYGLAFDYVAPGTFNDQRRGYWRYQLSWGGPSDEVRYYSDGPRFQPHRVTYVFLDWWDGHERKLRGQDERLMLELWDWFSEADVTQSEYDKACEEIDQ